MYYLSKSVLSVPNAKAIDLASSDVKTVDTDMSLLDICKLLTDNNINNTPVIEDDKIVGVINENDIIKAVAFENLDKKAADIMSTAILTAKDNINLNTAMDLLQQNNVSLIILIDNDENISGILTFTDILKAFISFLN